MKSSFLLPLILIPGHHQPVNQPHKRSEKKSRDQAQNDPGEALGQGIDRNEKRRGQNQGAGQIEQHGLPERSLPPDPGQQPTEKSCLN